MTTEEHAKCYVDIIRLMKRLWNDCKMVHGDLSPYNLLWDGDLILIDVSQSVEHDHPLSLEFLKRDLKNINNYYKYMGVHTFKLRSLFDFIVNKSDISDEKCVMKMKRESMDNPDSPEDQQQFMLTSIHRSLNDIPVDKLEEIISQLLNDPDSISYLKMIGLKDEHTKNEGNGEGSLQDELKDNDDEIQEEDEEEEGEEESAEEGSEESFSDAGSYKSIEYGNDESDSESIGNEENGDKNENESENKDDSIKVEPKIEEVIPADATAKNVTKSRIMDTLEKKSYTVGGDGLNLENLLDPSDPVERKPRVDPFEGMSKQERHKKVKEENREKRQNKMPKKEKRKLTKKK